MLTQKMLKDRLSYNWETGEFHWKSRHCNAIHTGDLAGMTQLGYRVIRLYGVRYPAHRLAWLYMTGRWPLVLIDHKDRDRLNNRWVNLREATHQQNQQNRGASKRNKFGIKGVYKYRTGYRAHIRAEGKMKSLGTFKTPEEAGRAYQKAAQLYHGEFAAMVG